MSTPSRTPRSLRPGGQALGILLVVISAAGFGSGALLVQPLYDAAMQPLVVLAWRFGTAAMLSWVYLLAFGRTRRALRRLSRRRVVVLLLLGILYVGNSYSYFAALEVVSISLVSIISYLYPAVVAVMAVRLVARLEGRRAWLALGLSMLGVTLAVGGIPEGSAPPLWGLLLAFANPVIYATWIVFQARLAGDRPRRAPSRVPGQDEPALLIPPGDAETVAETPDPAVAAAIMTTATATMYVVLALVTGASISPADVPAGAWLPLLGLGLIATAVAIQAFYAGVRRVGAARASLISTVEPIYTIALAVILFDEHLTGLQIIGGVLVLLAVLLAETGRAGDRRRSVVQPADTVTQEAGAGQP